MPAPARNEGVRIGQRLKQRSEDALDFLNIHSESLRGKRKGEACASPQHNQVLAPVTKNLKEHDEEVNKVKVEG